MESDGPTDLDALPVDDDVDEDAPTELAGAKEGGDPLGPGRMLGDYRIARKIGVGGMGIVLGALHPVIGKRVAIKVLKTDDPAILSRFVDEASVVNQIRHPNIVDIFGFGTMKDGRKYMVMEWLDGESLRTRLERGPIPLDELVDIVRPLARALAAAHDKGVIHRDLKPENVFLAQVHGERPQVKLLDFGIAKVIGPAPSSLVRGRTAIGEVVGTPMYSAPEQAAGKPVDHRIDIYALGAVVFEMLTGRPPFVGDSTTAVLSMHMIEDAPRMSTLTAIPRELDEIIAAMLAKRADARPRLADLVAVCDRIARGGVELVHTEPVARVVPQGRLTPTVQMEIAAMPVITGAQPVIARPTPVAHATIASASMAAVSPPPMQRVSAPMTPAQLGIVPPEQSYDIKPRGRRAALILIYIAIAAIALAIGIAIT